MKYRYLNINEVNIEEVTKHVSSARLEKTSKLKTDADKKRSVCVEYLLNEMINEVVEGIEVPVMLTYDEKGKPHIYDNDGKDAIQFSLSHSGDYVACIVSDRECGIDIEKHSDRRDYEKIAKRICTESELKMIKSSEEFYDLWTLKEAILKATGMGLSLDMRKVEFVNDSNGLSQEINNNEKTFITEVFGTTYKGTILKAPEGYSLSYVEEII
ncbi:MAG: 4'-phosphopantetheinyl transferase superfamily protein [Lachnospiraceae bacterium]|nr:4'-phosphopantetheinyl transferase superfamily protein [Lachnospiraceae bacterium]